MCLYLARRVSALPAALATLPASLPVPDAPRTCKYLKYLVLVTWLLSTRIQMYISIALRIRVI